VTCGQRSDVGAAVGVSQRQLAGRVSGDGDVGCPGPPVYPAPRFARC
jgi:hypothetical protein